MMWVAWPVAMLVALVGFYLSVFFLPYPLFPHYLEHAGFSVYSDREIPAGFELELEDARRRAVAMELYRDRRPPRIFVCQSQRLFGFFIKFSYWW